MIASFRRSSQVRPAAPKTDGRLVYAVGDIHGRYDLLTRMLELIVADVNVSPSEQPPMLIFLGDYVDRGPRSAEVVESMIWLRHRQEFEVRLLKGNHEQAMSGFLADPMENAAWIGYGGDATLMSYGVRVPRPLDRGALTEVRDQLIEKLPSEHRAFLEDLETMVVVGDYAFVHAGVRPGVPLESQEPEDLLWIRREFLNSTGPFEKIIVHGHTWEPEAQVFSHRLGIDTGAYATGLLTAARIDETGYRLIQASTTPAAALT